MNLNQKAFLYARIMYEHLSVKTMLEPVFITFFHAKANINSLMLNKILQRNVVNTGSYNA